MTPDLQAQSPGEDKEPNRLPAPKDEFILKLRQCWPNDEPPALLDGSRKILEVKQAS